MWAFEVAPTKGQLAHAAVRGDNLLTADEADAADKIADRADAIAHEDDPDARREAAEPPLASGRREWTKVEKPRKPSSQRLDA
jgi:hypothetical protein